MLFNDRIVSTVGLSILLKFVIFAFLKVLRNVHFFGLASAMFFKFPPFPKRTREYLNFAILP